VEPRAGMDNVEKILGPTGTRTHDPSVVQPAASRYTDYPTPTREVRLFFFLEINFAVALMSINAYQNVLKYSRETNAFPSFTY
jgi:hypothetical protein